jgi:pyruvate/2-oxoacid:ferredoxin oxidoreductase beta subunit
MAVERHKVAKPVGYPAAHPKRQRHFLANCHGFNAVHGRMPSVATGAYMANRDLMYIGVFGRWRLCLYRDGPVRPRHPQKPQYRLYYHE